MPTYCTTTNINTYTSDGRYNSDNSIINGNFNNTTWALNTTADRVEATNQQVNNLQVSVSDIYREIQDLKERGKEDMIESMKILDLYKKNRTAYINNEYDKEFNKLKDSNKIMKEYKDLVNGFEASMQQLYTSQFAEGQTESTIDKKELAIINLTEAAYQYEINENYYPEAAKALEDKKAGELAELDKNCAAAAAMLSICKTKDEVEDILKKYDIIKSGKLNLLDIK